MPHHPQIECTGRVTDIFAHRFVLETESGRFLADLGPKGAEQISLKVGDKVSIHGERKPSEIKVRTIAKDGQDPIEIGHPPKHGPDHGPKHGPKHEHKHGPHAHKPFVDPSVALQAAERAGYTVVGEPRRKPKHFDVPARNATGLVDLHIELDGTIRKVKPVAHA